MEGGRNIHMQTYVVKKGDTLYKISNRFGITIQSLLIANPQIQQGEYIYPGQQIQVPESVLREYVVQRGNTLYYIAELFNLSLRELIQVNPQIKNPDQLVPGEIIYIPRKTSSDIVQTDQEYGYTDLENDIKELTSRFSFIQVQEIGKSVMGKKIYAIRLGRGAKEVFYSGDWHANEYLTAPLLMKYVEDYAKAYSQKRTLKGYDVNYLYNNMSIWIVPMVNPDGVELVQEGITPNHPFYQTVLQINNGSKDFDGWSANIRGVDLNHQWPADWEQENARSPQSPSPRKYGGKAPLTEPETIAIYNFTIQHDFRMVLAFHSQGQVIYWGFKGLEPTNSQQIVNRFGILTGYAPVQTAESAAGYKDWFIKEYRKFGFTIEVGNGINPLPIKQFDQIYRENLSLLLEAPLL